MLNVPSGHGGVQGVSEGGHAALADHTKALRLAGLAYCGGGERCQEKEQDQPSAPHLHHGQDPQRLLQQAERPVSIAALVWKKKFLHLIGHFFMSFCQY